MKGVVFWKNDIGLCPGDDAGHSALLGAPPRCGMTSNPNPYHGLKPGLCIQLPVLTHEYL
jgi:hypothetical protein